MSYSDNDNALEKLKKDINDHLQLLHLLILSEEYNPEYSEKMHQAYNKLMDARGLLK